MKRKLCLLILSLLLTTPYITGGENINGFADDTEIPNAHTMMKVRGRKKWKTVTDVAKQKKAVNAAAQQAYLSSPEGKAELAAASKGISQRKKRLILKGDIPFAPSIDDQPTYWKVNSSLPRRIDSFQSNISWFAGFIRKTLTNAGLSRRQAKKLVKEYFPSNRAIRKEAGETNKTADALRYEYTVRQIVLHRYLRNHVNDWRVSQVKSFREQHTKECAKLEQQLVMMGGWESPEDVRKGYDHRLKSALTPMVKYQAGVMKGLQLEMKQIREWAEVKNYATKENVQLLGKVLKQLEAIRLDLDVLLENAVKKNMKLTRAQVLAAANKKAAEIEQLWKSRISEKRASILQKRDEYLASEDYRTRTTLHWKIKEHKYTMNDFDDFIKQSLRIPYDMLCNLEESTPWTNFESSINWIKGEHVLTGLFTRAAEFDLVHHPVLLNNGVTPWSLREALSINGTFNQSQRFISIPRSTAELEKMTYPELTSYAKERGIKTWVREWVDDKRTVVPMPADQLVRACATTLHLDSPRDGQVLYELGIHYNEVFSESQIFKNKWAGDVYSFTAPSVEAHAKTVMAEKVDHLLSDFDF